LIEEFESKESCHKCVRLNAGVHISKQIFPSHVVAFRIANSKKLHYCRNTGETMFPGLCQNSSVGPQSILSWPTERTLSTNG